MTQLPDNMPATQEEAFAYFATVTKPTVNDFKLMILLEASGQSFYGAMAAGAGNKEIADLLSANGREEMAHATRLQKAIKLITGEDFPIPTPEENPYDSQPETVPFDAAMMDMISQGEFGGEVMYDAWADTMDSEEVAKLLRQNGKEERRHGERALKVKELLNS